MKPWTYGLALGLAACVQQQPATQFQTGTGRVEVFAPTGSPRPTFSVLGEPLPIELALASDVVGRAVALEPLPRPPLSASSRATLFPVGAGAVSEVRQVTIAFDVLGAGANSIAAVEFLDPNGAPYFREEATIVGSVYDTHHLEFALPVAATAIESNKLSGAWSAQLLIDGRRVASQGFVLTP